MPKPNEVTVDTRSKILDIAERLAQQRGFNGFSYADIASEMHLTNAALHYHFRGKAELGESLIARYSERFLAALAAIDAAGGPAPERLRAYADLYLSVLREDRMCLCGVLASEHLTLPEPMRRAVVGFFEDNRQWLAGVLETGREAETLRFPGSADRQAQLTMAALEGAMLVARPYGSTASFEAIASQLLSELIA